MRTAEITIGNQSADRPFFDSDVQYQAAVCVLYHNLIVSLLNYCNNIIRIHWNENCTIQTILQYAETTANVQDTKCSKSLKSPICHYSYGIFIMLLKKGPRDDMANYRAICLLSHSYKLLSAVVARRLMAVLEGHLPDTQAGFRPARGCRDNVCALSWFINMVLCEGRRAVVIFIAGLDRIFRLHDHVNAGMTVGAGANTVCMSKCDYADDAALIDENMLGKLQPGSLRWPLGLLKMLR